MTCGMVFMQEEFSMKQNLFSGQGFCKNLRIKIIDK